MNNLYFVLARGEDKPYTMIMNKEEFERQLNNGNFHKYEFLQTPPSNLMEFPSNSIFVMCGAIVSK